MKLRFNFGEGGFKGFALRHSEKVVFGVVLALVGFFVYTSATQEGYNSEQGPEQLKAQAESARTHINTDHWVVLAPDRLAKVDDYPERAGVWRKPVRDLDYAPDRPMDPPLIPPENKRVDPEIFSPLKVEAVAVVGPVLWRPRQPEEDPFLNDKDAIETPKAPPKPKKKKPKPNMYDPEGMYPAGMAPSGEDPYMGEMGPQPPGMEYSPMGPGTAAGMRRALGPFYRQHYLRGFQASGMAGGGMPMPGYETGAAPGAAPGAALSVISKSFAVVSVKAVVPFEKQWEAYERTLAGAQGYSPGQDIPRYIMFLAERAEVGPDPQAPLDWKPISNTSYALNMMMQYAGSPRELVDPNYLLPGVLSMPLPPLLLQPYAKLALHAEVPQVELRPVVAPGQQVPGQQPEGTEPLAPTTDLNEGLPKLPPVAPGGTMPGQTPYGPGYEGMAPGYGTSPYGGADPYGAYGGGTTPYGMGPGYGSEGGYGTPGGYNPYGTGMPGQPRQPPPKYKLVRFFDFTGEIGKTYRYRVSVVLEDPNRPRDPRTDPSKRILDSAVVARLAKVEADDQDYLKRTGKERRTFWRQTEWSTPSEPVTVPRPDFFVAGAATAAKMIPLSIGGPLVQMSDPQAKLVSVVWDRRRAVETPAERDVFRGSYLNFEQDADVLHPATLAIKRLEKYAFKTNAYVADLRGGEDLIKDVDKEARTETLYTTPGEVLVVDGLGNLVVCNEIADCEEYRRVLFIEDSPVVATAPTGPTGYEGMEGAYPGSPYFGPGAFPGGGP